MRKIVKVKIALMLTFLLTACVEISHPAVETLYLKGDNIDAMKQEALPRLLEHYMTSKKDKEVYEVISKYGRFILNFNPSLKLLTLCGDPGSGWGPQFKDVDEAILKKLVDYGLSFDDIQEIGSPFSQGDTLLVRNKPTYLVKSNGHPI